MSGSRSSIPSCSGAPTCSSSTRSSSVCRLGELQHAPEQAERAVEIGLICAGTETGRTDDDQLTVIDLTGVGVQDVAAANTVLANVAPDAGEWIRL